jgi:hypothetical protein
MARSNHPREGVETSLPASQIAKLTQHSTQYNTAAEFAGFLTREDDEAVYIADKQGTWVIQRADLVFLEDWADWQSVPNFFAGTGRPVRVGVAFGATIHEIRPWQIRTTQDTPLGGSRYRQSVEMVFTLGAGALPNQDNAAAGERQLAALERLAARRLGWAPNPKGNPRHDVVPSYSQTIVVCDGYCDYDCSF